MKESVDRLKLAQLLREKAELGFDLINISNLKSNLSEEEILKLIHELEVHQIELEMQNEQLILSMEQTEKATEKYIELYDFIPSAYFILSKEGNIDAINFSGSQLLGKDRFKLINSRLGFFISDDTKPIFNSFLDEVFKDKAKKKCEVVILNNNGNHNYLLFTGVISDDSTQCHIIGVDITERKLMEMEFRKAKEEALAANKAKTDFLANMSHEIRTPLNGIIGFTDLLMNSSLNEDQMVYMSTINESATTLFHIVNEVLDFSKIEAGKFELENTETNLFELSNQVIDLFRYQSMQKNIDLRLNLDKNVTQFILTDTTRLKQVLVNLLSNALRFTDSGVIILEIDEIPTLNKEYSTIKFSVKDTGIGIEEVNNEKIFKSFEQCDSSTSRKFGGTGLGLTISNQLLNLMGSKLNLKSKFGEGSDFFFTIKVKKVKHKNSSLITAESPIAVQENRNKANLFYNKILIVEDNKINMLLAKTLVKKILPNCAIIEAKDGNEAVEFYEKQKPDAILMDIQMPNKNGYEAANEIRKLDGSENIPIIAVTAGILIGEREKCFKSGMDDYLAKPIIIAELENILFKWLNK